MQVISERIKIATESPDDDHQTAFPPAIVDAG